MTKCLVCQIAAAATAPPNDPADLIRWYAAQVHGLATEAPIPVCSEAPVEALLGDEAVYRKPPRVAAPKLVALLADAGWVLVRK